MPAFQVLNTIRGIKPGASVIATVRDSTGAIHPGVIVERYARSQRRHAIAMSGAGFSRSRSPSRYGQSWRQMIRWLVSDVPNRVELVAEPQPGDPNQAVQLPFAFATKNFSPLDNAKVTVNVQWIGDQRLPGRTQLWLSPISHQYHSHYRRTIAN